MANITLPALLRVASVEPDLTENAQRNRSAWTGKSKILGLPGNQFWTFNVQFRTVSTEAAIRAGRAFFFALRGMVNTFDLPVTPTPQFAAGTTQPTITSGGAVGARTATFSSVANVIDGMFASVALPSGHKRLFVPISKAGSVVTFEPSMIESVAGGATVEIIRPVMRARLTSPRYGYSDSDGVVTFSASVEEAI